MGQAKRKQEAARRAVDEIDLSIFKNTDVRNAVRDHMARTGAVQQTSKADRGGDNGQDSVQPAIRVRESAETAQAGVVSASPLNVSIDEGAGSAGLSNADGRPAPGEIHERRAAR